MSGDHENLIRVAIAAEVFNAGEVGYWERRAKHFELAKPRLDDFHGQATRADLSTAWNRCHASAQACRNKARLLRGEVA